MHFGINYFADENEIKAENYDWVITFFHEKTMDNYFL